MKKYAIIILFLLSGCGETVQRATEVVDLKNVKGFEDCVYTRIDPGGRLPIITAVRCPHSSTTAIYPVGKVRATTVVIDGIEYIPLEKK